MKKSIYLPLFTAALPLSLIADVTEQKDSSLFDYKWEMTVDASTEDLDGNLTSDFFAGTAGGFTTPQDYSDGLANSNSMGVPQEVLFRTDFVGSISRVALTEAFTIEFSVRLEAGTQEVGAVGTFGIVLDHVNDTNSLRVNIDEDNVSFNFDGVDAIPTTSNTDAQHTFRIAYEGTGTDYYIWRDSVLLNVDSVTPFVASNGDPNVNGVWFIGDFSGSLSGEWELDYIRATAGAFAPVGAAGNADLHITEIEIVGGSEVVIAWASVPGKVYRIQTSPDLKQWTNLTPDIPADPSGSETVVTAELLPPEPENNYFRVQLLP